MSSANVNGHGGGKKGKRTRSARPPGELGRRQANIVIERCGDWIPADELRDAARNALETGGDVTADLARVDHLDAGTLQILLAVDAEQKQRGRTLTLANAFPHLRQWFEFAGVADHFLIADFTSDE